MDIAETLPNESDAFTPWPKDKKFPFQPINATVLLEIRPTASPLIMPDKAKVLREFAVGRVLVPSDGVYTMSGALAPLRVKEGDEVVAIANSMGRFEDGVAAALEARGVPRSYLKHVAAVEERNIIGILRDVE